VPAAAGDPVATKDRWHQLADAIQASNLPASDKSVFRYLLDKADYVTAAMPAKFTPAQTDTGRKTSHSRRQVQYSAAHLRRHGWLVTKRASRKLAYEFGFGADCDCTGRVHEPRPKGATADGERRNGCAPIGATDRRNAAGQTMIRTERQREGEVRGQVETEQQQRRYPQSWSLWPAGSIGEQANRARD